MAEEKLSTEVVSNPPPPAATTKPEGIPDKFWKDGKVDVTGLAKSYTELEAKHSTPPAPPKPTTDTVTVQSVLDKAGLTQASLTKEYLDNQGKLTPETIAKLATAGVSQAQIETYVAGAKSAADKVVALVTQAAGGPEKLTAIYAWAVANMTQDEIDSYNSILDSGNAGAAKIAFEGLLSRHTAANGQDPKLTNSESAPNTSGVKPFGSLGEQTAAIRDPRYASDAAYRKGVEDRMKASDLMTVRAG